MTIAELQRLANALGQMPTFLLIVVSAAGVSLATLLSVIKSVSTRLGIVLVIGLGAFTVAMYAPPIFRQLNTGGVYEDFFGNLAAEFIGALLIFIIFDDWRKGESLLLPFFVVLMLFGACVVLLQLNIDALLTMGMYAVFMQRFCTGLGLEIFGIVLMFLGFVTFGAVIKLGQSPGLDASRRLLAWLIGLSLVLLLILGVVMAILAMQLNREMTLRLLTTLAGAVVTSFILGSWVTSESVFFPIISAFIVFVIGVCLVEIGRFGQEFSLSWSAEFLGALVTTVLLQRRWLWNT